MTEPTPASTPTTTPRAASTRVDVAIQGIRLLDAPVSRRAGAGPSDDGHVLLEGVGAAVPLNPRSPYSVRGGRLLLDGADTGMGVESVARPRFYDLVTEDGVPYEKIARLHSDRVLATTVVQTCVRYDESERCRFCAIEESLRNDSTVAVKTPAQLAEVARAAVELDGVTQMVMTTGTSNGRDRGATHLARCVRAVREACPDLPIQVQCEPPGDLRTITDLYEAGARSIGIHVESLDDDVRRRVMPGKGSVPMSEYRDAWAEAVRVFGWNQVSTYLIVGLGEDPDELVAGAEELIAMGVYPFVVPFRPIAGTLAVEVDGTTPPPHEVTYDVTRRVAAALHRAGMSGADQAAGCASCGACSALGSAQSGLGAATQRPCGVSA
ncbi:MSMEG_0568 family radical SAM protein [Nocardioides bruguierae]|uniref:MSMEG_0568 family radical SAM protein n=1 Tax=Nocardioides bruguierae TaxID=2945102 RepID=UPI0020209886|nr:MSMEG_0568 family radical SAM protein [Nocardioides bruguierae]MCL8026881.1 MSMEG_0568 family radical SAM protein [Nocardioides bruguierae]